MAQGNGVRMRVRKSARRDRGFSAAEPVRSTPSLPRERMNVDRLSERRERQAIRREGCEL